MKARVTVGAVVFDRLDIYRIAFPAYEAHVRVGSPYAAGPLSTPGERRRRDGLRAEAERKLSIRVPGAVVTAWTVDL